MKTFFVCWVIGLALPVLALAQSAFQKGAVVLQPGIGYGLIGTEGEVEVPPVSVNLEFSGSSEWARRGRDTPRSPRIRWPALRFRRESPIGRVP